MAGVRYRAGKCEVVSVEFECTKIRPYGLVRYNIDWRLLLAGTTYSRPVFWSCGIVKKFANTRTEQLCLRWMNECVAKLYTNCYEKKEKNILFTIILECAIMFPFFPYYLFFFFEGTLNFQFVILHFASACEMCVLIYASYGWYFGKLLQIFAGRDFAAGQVIYALWPNNALTWTIKIPLFHQYTDFVL